MHFDDIKDLTMHTDHQGVGGLLTQVADNLNNLNEDAMWDFKETFRERIAEGDAAARATVGILSQLAQERGLDNLSQALEEGSYGLDTIGAVTGYPEDVSKRFTRNVTNDMRKFKGAPLLAILPYLQGRALKSIWDSPKKRREEWRDQVPQVYNKELEALKYLRRTGAVNERMRRQRLNK